ncbi:MAG TPA: cobalamin B12-binding domain-containing protein [Trebonia sp.]|jgi:methylaspartate mutase sigma subunit|nr:cobalamin B12-binding domain-containing protein [Trebonia sp.]
MNSDQPPSPGRERPLTIVVSGLSSDAHTWNLVYLQLVLEELGHVVTNLGACLGEEELAARCRAIAPDLIALSSVNGHGYRDGRRAIAALRQCPALVTTPVVIGGKLDTVGGDPTMAGELLDAGFDAVFTEAGALAAFRSFVACVAGAGDGQGRASVTSPVGA